MARLCRIISGHPRALVLSGGGARGFAHIGVRKAMHELAIPIDLFAGSSMGSPWTSQAPMWLDVEVIGRPEGNPELYILRMDLQQAEEVALAQNVGAQFSLALRPAVDTREVDRSFFGETQDRVMDRYNFPIPEFIDAFDYPQPVAFPSPFPAEPYVELAPSPSPEPDDELIDIPIDTELETPEPEA